MKIHLQELEHQRKALQACAHVFNGLDVQEARNNYSNLTKEI